jgi:hypothetical protein
MTGSPDIDRRDLMRLAASTVIATGVPAAAAAGGTPQLDGPITGGRRGHAFGAATVDLAAHGFVEEEYFFAGEAARFALADGTRGADGRWAARPVGSAPFKSRFLVRRPVDPARFNGTVVVLWNNVSGGFDLITAQSPELLAGGFALVAVTCQQVGVNGFPTQPLGLRQWDPDRYGSLDISDDDLSYDIYSQAARLVGPDRPRLGPDPLGGLAVRRLLSRGGSQSAARLATYINAVHPLARIFDGFLLDVYFGEGSALQMPAGQGPLIVANRPAGWQRPPGSHILRTDTAVPVMVVNSESEALSYYPVRQPDSDRFRYWEAAGTAHFSTATTAAMAPTLARDLGVPEMPGAAFAQQNSIDTGPLSDAALAHMQRWLNGGPAPPAAPRLAIAGSPPEIERDGHGIARGGIRLPEVAVPTASHSGVNDGGGALSLMGRSVPFDDATLKALYPTHGAYVAAFEKAARAAEAAGFLLKRDADRLIAEAARAAVPA